MDPIYGGPQRAVPAHQHKPWNKRFVWPRDKEQKGARAWSRWKDIITGKGPDMWISRQRSTGPHRPVWSGWNDPSWDNLGYTFRNDNTRDPLPYAYRPPWEKYDFKTRRYRAPYPGIWSDVKWDVDGRKALYRRDHRHGVWVNPEYDDGWHNYRGGPNPFKWHDHTPYWDWHHDRIQLRNRRRRYR